MQEIANLIPNNARAVILEQNLISEAKAHIWGDEATEYLLKVWKEFVEPTLDARCGICRGRVIQNYRELQPTLIQMEKDGKLLND